MDIDARSIYRYFELLEEVGFIIEKDFHNNYFIADYGDINEGIEFSQEEAELVHQLVDTGANGKPSGVSKYQSGKESSVALAFGRMSKHIRVKSEHHPPQFCWTIQ